MIDHVNFSIATSTKTSDADVGVDVAMLILCFRDVYCDESVGILKAQKCLNGTREPLGASHWS